MNLTEFGLEMGKFVRGSFATIGEDGTPDIRGWELQFVHDGKLLFTTSNEKAVWRQLQQNPGAAFFGTVGDLSFRVSGTVRVAEGALKEYVFQNMDEGVKKLYPAIDANGFEAMYFEQGKVQYARGKEPFQSFAF